MSIIEKKYILFKKPTDGSNNYYLLDSGEDLKNMVGKHLTAGITDTILLKNIDFTKLKITE